MKLSITHIKRDPLARATLMREYDPAGGSYTCAECGIKPAPYRYTWDSDDNPRVVKFSGREQFCSIGCWRYYTS